MAAPVALLVGPLFFENAKWRSLSPGIPLKVRKRCIFLPAWAGVREDTEHDLRSIELEPAQISYKTAETASTMAW